MYVCMYVYVCMLDIELCLLIGHDDGDTTLIRFGELATTSIRFNVSNVKIQFCSFSDSGFYTGGK